MNAATRRQFDRLNQETEELLAELRAYAEAELNQPPRPGAWSAVQTMHHLMLTEGAALTYLRKKLSHQPQLKRAGLPEKAREWLLALYFRTNMKRQAPAYISGDRLPQTASLTTTQEQWRKARQALRDYLAGLDASVFTKSVFKHPFVGRMSLAGMLYFHLLHFRHHRKQIRAAVRQAAAVN
jgi:uncharacterized damage-inducible protein DinB